MKAKSTFHPVLLHAHFSSHVIDTGVRFNFGLRAPRYTGVYRLFRDQRRFMLATTTRMSGTRFVTKLSGQEIRSYVKLALAEIRRGRHRGVTARALVEDSARAQEFMFWFIRKFALNSS